MRKTTLALVMAASLSALPALAQEAPGQAPPKDSRAGTYQCAPNSADSVILTCIPTTAENPECETPPVAAPVAAAVIAPAIAPPEVVAAPPAPTLDGRLSDFVFPTGETLRRGEVVLKVHEFGLYNSLSIGVADGVELEVGAPVVPVVASLGARVSLLPHRFPLRLVASATLWAPLTGETDDVLVSGSVTAAYQSEHFNLHATTGVAFIPGHPNDALGELSAGLAWQVSPRVALIGDYFVFGDSVLVGCDDGCGSDNFTGPMFGGKLLGQHFDADLGLLIATERASDYYYSSSHTTVVPVASASYKF